MVLTISGPPSTTRRLFKESEQFSKNHRVPIPVYAPYHAQHLYNDAEVARIIDPKTREFLREYRPLWLEEEGLSYDGRSSRLLGSTIMKSFFPSSPRAPAEWK
ncbi:hypothetical protein BU16DRAFT_747 [Lophium mytilinum]|uniref:Starter acyltransferase (SAT) domain-containing protein n=1 Tax=Lophium mytilinum TaxID=390894 RepID=A0A6A6REA7_9PEZI|nr:hypothetical protein BU16DRAFT_747 [Lophium mytilinum]